MLSTFQWLMEAVLNGLVWNTCFVYIDNVLVCSKPLMSIWTWTTWIRFLCGWNWKLRNVFCYKQRFPILVTSWYQARPQEDEVYCSQHQLISLGYIKEDVLFESATECDEVFSQLKSSLISALVPAYPQFNSSDPFVVETNVSIPEVKAGQLWKYY